MFSRKVLPPLEQFNCDPNAIVRLHVVANKLENDMLPLVVYEGTAFDVLKDIAHRHSYCQFDDYATFDEMVNDGRHSSVGSMYEQLMINNGDGCDYISVYQLN